MSKLLHLSSILLLLILLVSCSAKINDYQNSSPKFDIKRYFNGKLLAWGIVQDYSNKVTRRFCVELNATWQGNYGELAEVFYFDNGEVSYRTWQLTKSPQGEYTGTAEDVVGLAKGKHAGYAFHWQYQLLVPIDEDTYQFTMDDWMYQIDEQRVMNKTSMSKLGITVAEITLFFDKSLQQNTCR